MYLPWSYIHSFECNACGICCSHFSVPLRPNEALEISRKLGRYYVEIRKDRFFLRKEGRSCPFLLSSHLCYLQMLGMKPRACKLWPFYIFKNPEYGRREEAAFSSKLGTFYIYLDPRCPGIAIGRPTEKLMSAIEEAVEIWLGLRREQVLTTSSLKALARMGHEPMPKIAQIEGSWLLSSIGPQIPEIGELRNQSHRGALYRLE
jgi:Fe-S-cluster containining protein